MIKTSNLSKKFGTKYVLKNITIEIKKGRNLGIVGKNGAGKTTLMNLLIGINNQTSGEVEYDFHKKDINKIIGVQMQGGFFEPSLKVKEICKLYCALYNIPYSKVIEIMEKLEISNIQNLNLTKLSGGESQKMNILLAVLHNPEVLFFDELTTGLDAISRSNIYDDMKRLKKNGENNYSGISLF